MRGDLNGFCLVGRTEGETALFWVVVRVIPSTRRRVEFDCVRDGGVDGDWLGGLGELGLRAGLDGGFCLGGCLRALDGTGGGGIIFAED